MTPLACRRLTFGALVAATVVVLVGMTYAVLARDGLTILEAAMVAASCLTLPWLAIGFWNAVIGFVVLCAGDRGRAAVVPLREAVEQGETPPTALVMAIFNENPDAAFHYLKTTVDSLDRAGAAAGVDVFVLSDTRLPAIAAREAALFAAWRSDDAKPERLHYRRRPENTGYKAGNLRDFCIRFGDAYRYMIVLDCDSVMSGTTVRRLVGLMEANPRLGILQTLVAGMPAESGFARIFQFGMRFGMRSYTLGSQWWQGDAGPYWGHNAIIRLRPFIDHAALPALRGRPPLGGTLLSHDQVEAALMRAAGYEVRVLPEEEGTFEANPPSLPAFLKRDLRWCQGNMQYLQLVGRPGFRAMGRLQLTLAILMYQSAPAWMAIVALGLASGLLAAAGIGVPVVAAAPAAPPPATLGWGLLASIITMALAPKLTAMAVVLARRSARRAWGGAGRLLAGAGIEFLFTNLLAPIVAVVEASFVAGLVFGRDAGWQAQVRAAAALSWRSAAGVLWPATLFGLVVAVVLAVTAPHMLWLAAPMVVGMVGAVPFAVLTASPAFGQWLSRRGLCATPEERAPSAEIAAACPWLTAQPFPGSVTSVPPAVLAEATAGTAAP